MNARKGFNTEPGTVRAVDGQELLLSPAPRPPRLRTRTSGGESCRRSRAGCPPPGGCVAPRGCGEGPAGAQERLRAGPGGGWRRPGRVGIAGGCAVGPGNRAQGSGRGLTEAGGSRGWDPPGRRGQGRPEELAPAPAPAPAKMAPLPRAPAPRAPPLRAQPRGPRAPGRGML